MGCGDTIADVATGGVSGAIQSGSAAGALTSLGTGGLGASGVNNLLTGGAYSLLGNQSPLKNIMDANVTSLVSGGLNNVQAASGYKNFASQMDALIDPSRGNDALIKGSGKWIEQNLPLGNGIVAAAPMVMSAAGG